MEKQFIVSARKYRPLSFETVVGQPSITRTLKNAISGQHLAHAYLFTGPRGVGKTTCARIFAKTINCTNLTPETEACNKCEACLTFQESRSFNIHELDAASNNHVEDIRNLIEQVRIPPQMGKYSVYIIDEVHMLSQAAFNAFLKTLEEPPAHAIFILATTEKHKILPTILSRCQVFDFHRIRIRDIIGQLQTIAEREGITAEDSALNIIAQKADGAMRDALSIFDQVVSFCGDHITYQQVIDHLNVLDYDYYFQLTGMFLSGDYRQALLVFNRILEEGFDGHNFISGLATHFRDLLVSRDHETIELLEVGEEIGRKYQQTAASCSINFLYEGLRILNGCDLSFKQAKDQRLLVELAIISLCRIEGAFAAPTAVSAAPAGSALAAPTPAKAPVMPLAPTAGSSATPASAQAPAAAASPVQAPSPVLAPAPVQTLPAGSPAAAATRPSSPTMTRISDLTARKVMAEPVSPAAAESDDALENDGAQEALTPDRFREFWLEFSESLKDDQPRLYSTLTIQVPELSSDNKIMLKLNNPLQEKAIRSIQTELLQFLRKRSGVNDLDIQTEIPEGTRGKVPYTQQEKYQHFLEKNPGLDLFRQALGLDLE